MLIELEKKRFETLELIAHFLVMKKFKLGPIVKIVEVDGENVGRIFDRSASC